MKNTIDGFNQNVLIELKLDVIEAVFLRWLLSFLASGKTKIYIDPESGEDFHWVKYSKIIDDLPIIFHNIFTVRRMIKKLTSINIPDPTKPLILKLVRTIHGTETYFKFNPLILERLEGSNMTTLLGSEYKIDNKTNKDKSKLNPNVYSLIQKLQKIKKEDGDNLFSMIFPKDEKHYSKSIYNFQNQLLDLYEGKFYKNYIYNIADWFSLKYKWYITDESKKLIQNCKGSWENIEKLILNSCKNLSKWYNVNNELTDKDKLPKNISTFIYNSFSKISMFYICLIKPPSEVREASTDSLYKTIDSVVRNEMKIVKKNDWDGYSFWNRVKKVQDYYDKNNLNVKYQYWLGNGIQEFIIGYKEFLIGLTGGLEFVNLGNVGTGNKTWEAFLNNKKEEFSI
jgi:hypothetical protein